MPIEQIAILKIPYYILGSIIVLFTVSLSLSGLFVVRRLISHKRLKPHNDVAGFIFGTMGVIYAVLLAFTVIVVWENYDEASTNVEKEAIYLADIYRDSECLQDPFRSELWKLLKEYGKAIVVEEWRTLSWGEQGRYTQKVQDDIWKLYGKYIPKNETERIFFEESVRKLDDLCELRRLRLMESSAGISHILWFVLVAGGLITICFTFFFGMENLRAQVLMTILLSAIISLILFTILEFDYPFTGNLSISSKPFKQIRLLREVRWDEVVIPEVQNP